MDDRIVRTDWDAGFIEGRQYGRGKTGGQVFFLNKIIIWRYYIKKIIHLLFFSYFPGQGRV